MGDSGKSLLFYTKKGCGIIPTAFSFNYQDQSSCFLLRTANAVPAARASIAKAKPTPASPVPGADVFFVPALAVVVVDAALVVVVADAVVTDVVVVVTA